MSNNPNEDGSFYLDEETIEYLKGVANLSRNQADVENMARTRPTNMRSREDLMSHMMTAHDMHPLSLQFYDESEHDAVPALRDRSRNWRGETVPKLDHEDLVNWHSHEHTAGPYAEDYPSTTLGDEHFHH